MHDALSRVSSEVPGTTDAGNTAREADGRVIESLRREVGDEDFGRFFSDLPSIRARPGRVEMAVPTRFRAEIVRTRFLGAIERAGNAACGRDVGTPVQVVVEVESPPVDSRRAAREGPPRQRHLPTTSNGFALKHRLEDFVAGESNAGAYAIAKVISDPSSEEQFSPFVVYGPCGVGKTHLLQGIARRWMELAPGLRVKYTTAESFTNEFLGSIRANRREEFRRAHRGVRLLCIDDVHYLSNRQGTQTELLHTLDAVDLAGARVVVASDAHPGQISKLNTALSSRLVSGALVGIGPPDAKLRAEIVRRMALRRGLMLTEDAVEFLVSRAVGTGGVASVRELEGLVLRVQAMRQFLPEGNESLVGVAGVRQALGMAGEGGGREVRRPQRPVRVRAIESHVCRVLGVPLEAVRGKIRSRQVVMARWLIAFLAHKLTNESYPGIAREMGRPSHSSIISACRSLEKLLADDARVSCPDVGEPVPLRRLVDDLADRLCRECGG